MRNLRNIAHGVFRVPDSSSASASAFPISASCWDPARDEVIIARGPAPGDGRIELLRVAKHPRHSSPSQL
jgi:elongator complex protein 1